MMHRAGINITVTCNKEEVLEQLRKNLVTHSTMVKESREGYLKSARAVLETRLKALEDGKLVGLSFDLTVPRDYTKVYESTIKMLEAHTEATIPLTADEFRRLMEDEWDWTDNFISINKAYSSRVGAYAVSKRGIDPDND